jgi:hypothetical protein
MSYCNKCNHNHSHCTCNHTVTPVVAGQISGELLGSNEIALIQNGVVIGKIPVITLGSLDILDAFGNAIP